LTISPPAVLLGSQTPRVLTRPDFTSEAAGREAVDLADSVGLILDPWQQLCTLVTLAENGDKWAAREVGKLIARQNGKGASDEAVALHGLFLLNLPLQLWTAHQFKTTTEAFLRLRSWIDGSDDLRRRVKRITTANGDEGIELKSGARLRFIARSKSSGRGFSPQRIFFDEAQELATAAVTAMMPSMGAQPNPQALYSGTVPGEDNNAEHWTRLRNRGRAGGGRRLAWVEWSPKGSEDGIDSVDLDSIEAWSEANPALGFRVTLETIETERESFDDDSFGRERLSVWPERSASVVIDPNAWKNRADPTSKPVGPVVFAVDTSQDRMTTVIAVAGRRSDGNTHVELVKYGAGSAWVLDELIRLSQAWDAAVVVDGISPAASLIPGLKEAGLDPVVTNASDMARACGLFHDGVVEGELFHLGDPELTKALMAAGRRPLAGGWAWNRKSGDIAPLVAATLASYGVLLLPDDEEPQVHEWPTDDELDDWEDE
jgi:hypothetical protein